MSAVPPPNLEAVNGAATGSAVPPAEFLRTLITRAIGSAPDTLTIRLQSHDCNGAITFAFVYGHLSRVEYVELSKLLTDTANIRLAALMGRKLS